MKSLKEYLSSVGSKINLFNPSKAGKKEEVSWEDIKKNIEEIDIEKLYGNIFYSLPRGTNINPSIEGESNDKNKVLNFLNEYMSSSNGYHKLKVRKDEAGNPLEEHIFELTKGEMYKDSSKGHIHFYYRQSNSSGTNNGSYTQSNNS